MCLEIATSVADMQNQENFKPLQGAAKNRALAGGNFYGQFADFKTGRFAPSRKP